MGSKNKTKLRILYLNGSVTFLNSKCNLFLLVESAKKKKNFLASTLSSHVRIAFYVYTPAVDISKNKAPQNTSSGFTAAVRQWFKFSERKNRNLCIPIPRVFITIPFFIYCPCWGGPINTTAEIFFPPNFSISAVMTHRDTARGKGTTSAKLRRNLLDNL